MNTLTFIGVLAGLIIVAEALNKLERTNPFARGMTLHERVTDSLKALAWALLALGGACAVATPALALPAPTLRDVSVLVGFAVLIVRTRVKEG